MNNNLIFQLKVIRFKISEALKLYEKTGEKDNFLKECIEELCYFILNEKNYMDFILNSDNNLIKNLIRDIRDRAAEALEILEKIEARNILNEENTAFKYGDDLALAVKREIEDYKILKSSKVLLIGSGAMPITAYTIFKETAAHITCVDIDSEALNLSKKVTDKLGIQGVYFEGDIEAVEIENFSHIIIASLVQKKCELVDYVSQKINNDAKIILRYGNEIKEAFNFPLCIKEINDFTKTVIRDKSFIYDTLLLERI